MNLGGAPVTLERPQIHNNLSVFAVGKRKQGASFGWMRRSHFLFPDLRLSLGLSHRREEERVYIGEGGMIVSFSNPSYKRNS